MKPVVADPRYKVHCLRIEPLRGAAVVYLTDHVRDLTIGGRTYRTDTGYQFSGYAGESSMSPGVMDLDGIVDVAGIGRDALASGVFDNARVYAFATTWLAPIEDEEPLGLAFMGKTTLRDNRYTAELMMAIDLLNQSVGKTYTAACPKQFGGQEYAGCMVDLTPITVTGTLTHVTDSGKFRDSTRTEVFDYFGEGTIAFTSGPNAGLKPMEIKRHVGVHSSTITGITNAAAAVITLGAHPFVVGDVAYISGVAGMTGINGLTPNVIAVTSTTITVDVNSGFLLTYTGGGTAAMVAGSIITHEPFHYLPSVGDAYEMVPGCRKRLEDCRDKWSNIDNFGGFSYVPTQSTYVASGGA